MTNISFEEQFQTVLLMLSPSKSEEKYSVDSGQLDEWFMKYEDWYLGDGTKIKESWLYHRELTVVGDDLFTYPKELHNILETCLNHHMSVIVETDLFELYSNFTVIKELCEQELIQAFYINAKGGDFIQEDEEFLLFIRRLLELQKQMVWVQSLRCLQKRGVLQQEFFNSQNVMFYGIENQESNIHVKEEYISSPCRNLMKICIGDDGYVYPCSGVMGMPEFAISHITDKNPMKRLLENSIPCFNIPELLVQGPSLNQKRSEITERDENPSLEICELHRMELLESEY